MKNETAPKTGEDLPHEPASTRFAPVPQSAPVKQLDGLYAAGEVIGRRRTAFQQKDGATRYNIAVALIGQSGKLIVERWTDNPSPPDVPRVGERCCVPVTLQHFSTKTGTGTRLCWGATERGEAF